MSSELHFDQFTFINDTYQAGLFNISLARIAKYNRTTHVLNGIWELLREMDENFEFEVTGHYNRFNNNQYTKSMFGIKRDTMCKIMDKYRHFIFTPTFKNHSNYHIDNPDGKFCPKKKVCI